jgi:hypothetical protein
MTNAVACMTLFFDYRTISLTVITALFVLIIDSTGSFAFATARSQAKCTVSYQKQEKAASVKRKMNQTSSLPAGIWGGSGVLITVGEKIVTIEYACSSGEITGPLKISSAGNFNAVGVHIQPRPGPLRANDKPNRQPARFEGKISGKSMSLKVSLIANNEVIGDFELTKDVVPRIRRCM